MKDTAAGHVVAEDTVEVVAVAAAEDMIETAIGVIGIEITALQAYGTR